jgi:tRNA(Ile2)-agmatinylcytidine synthase
MLRYLLGVDDTDSKFGHCTTHLAFLIVNELLRLGCDIPSFPRLVRLNPNIPFKTRGNAAVCIGFEAHEELADEAFKAAERLLMAEADTSNGANAALTMVREGFRPEFFRSLYLRAVSGIVNFRRVKRDISGMGIRCELLGNGMGVVGAASSMGFSESDDHTYELIAYRLPENCGAPRSVDPASVTQMERETFPHTFNSFDHGSGRVLLAPKGPDPVLLGIRGDSPDVVLEAFRSVKAGERLLGYMVYATNQCTDAHLTRELEVPLKAFSSGWLAGKVASAKTERGGHTAVSLDVGGSKVACMVYEPTGDLRFMARLLRPGDRVKVFGGVRRASSKNPAVVNVERIDVVDSKLAPPGSYLPSSRAQRHLTKQLIRYGRETCTRSGLVDGWVTRPASPPLASKARAPRKA